MKKLFCFLSGNFFIGIQSDKHMDESIWRRKSEELDLGYFRVTSFKVKTIIPKQSVLLQSYQLNVAKVLHS